MASHKANLGSLLDDVLADRRPAPAEAATPTAPLPSQPSSSPIPRATSERLTVSLSSDLVARIRGAVRTLKFGGGYPDLTLASFVSQALAQELRRLEDESGQTFTPFEGTLPAGRPLRR